MSISLARADAAEDSFFKRWDSYVSRAGVRRAPGALAEDVAQEARIRMLRLMRTGAQPSDVYVRALVRNETLKATIRIQRGATRATPDDVAVLRYADADVAEPPDVAARKAVRAWLQTLGPQERQVYELIYVRDMTQREAAREMAITQPRVNQIHAQLLERGRGELAALKARL